MSVTANLRLPSHVPQGYSLWTVVQGKDANGFGVIDSDDQYAVTYFRRRRLDDKGNALTVYKGPPGATTLAATDRRAGETIDLGVAGTTAFYHDGLWVLGPGPEQRGVRRVIMHWDRTSHHSITIRTSSEIWAVRGPKNNDIDKEELMRVAASLFAA